MYVLDIQNIKKSFGGIKVLSEVNIRVEEGGLVGLIGPNGAGKTTLINVITGFIKPDAGRILFYGRDITGLPPFRVARAGIVRTFQIPRILKNLTVEDNIRSAVLGNKRGENFEVGMQLLKSFGLDRFLNYPAKSLSGGQQKLLEFVRAIMHGGHLIILDEPVGGVHPSVINLMAQTLKELNREYNMSFLIVEHNIPFISEICDKIFVMNDGYVIAAGPAIDVLKAESVIEAYMGASDVTS